MDIYEIDKRFKYHAPRSDTRRQAHDDVRDLCKTLARELNSLIPEGREKSIVFTKIEETMFWANAGLARRPDEVTE